MWPSSAQWDVTGSVAGNFQQDVTGSVVGNFQGESWKLLKESWIQHLFKIFSFSFCRPGCQCNVWSFSSHFGPKRWPFRQNHKLKKVEQEDRNLNIWKYCRFATQALGFKLSFLHTKEKSTSIMSKEIFFVLLLFYCWT